MNQQNEENIFDVIQKRMIVNEMKSAFEKKKLSIKEVTILEYGDNNTTIKIITSDSNKITVDESEKKISWKLNALDMGEVCGNQIYDVAGSYEAEKFKDRR